MGYYLAAKVTGHRMFRGKLL